MSGKVNLDRWMPHLRAAKRKGKWLVEYARERGLSRYTLYAARALLSSGAGNAKRGAGGERRAGKGAAASAFAAVKLGTPATVPVPARTAQWRNFACSCPMG